MCLLQLDSHFLGLSQLSLEGVDLQLGCLELGLRSQLA